MDRPQEETTHAENGSRPDNVHSNSELDYCQRKLAQDLVNCKTEEEVVDVLVRLGLPREHAKGALQLALAAQRTAATERGLSTCPAFDGRSPACWRVRDQQRARENVALSRSDSFHFPTLAEPILNEGTFADFSPAMQSAFATCGPIPEQELVNDESYGDTSQKPWLARSLANSRREASLSDWVPDMKHMGSPRMTVGRLELGRVSSLDEWIAEMSTTA